jgi:hypothetical protein
MDDKAPKLHSFLEDETGGYSHRRLLTIIWFFMLMFLVVYLTVKKSEMPAISDNIMWLSLGWMGYGVGAKYVEKKPVSEVVKELVQQ